MTSHGARGPLKRMIAAAICLAIAMGVAAACTGGGNPRGGNRVNWDGPEYLAPPDPNPIGVVEFDGWEHCGWEHIRFLGVPGEVVPGVGEGRPFYEFVRTSTADLPWTVGEFEPDAELPEDARRTAHSESSRQLWFSPADAGTFAYIVDGETVERWPRFDGGCD